MSQTANKEQKQMEYKSSLSGFAPVIDEGTHTLILGSFPGVASLESQQYYGFRHNQFWRLMSAVIGKDLQALEYSHKLDQLLSAGVGLWDVFKSCQRQGSLDSAIRGGELNDFVTLKHQYPRLRRICFNGKTAAKIQAYFNEHAYETLVLPSSSPANAMLTLEQKLLIWQKIRLENDQ
ncbi:DNA-deoxyinosine glycosylase [Undibacterium sp. Ji67W]|uniref:DNA-deoxyinosine glycosylase n=1 Tax=Undibacterium sp. Ji67W TaxID=3413042 RepID=UPI003BF3D87E